MNRIILSIALIVLCSCNSKEQQKNNDLENVHGYDQEKEDSVTVIINDATKSLERRIKKVENEVDSLLKQE